MLKRYNKHQQEQKEENEVDYDESSSSSESSDSEQEHGSSASDNVDSDEESEDRKEKLKSKVMILCSRGINARQRHLMLDVCSLLPHSKKEAKFDTKSQLFHLNELAELNNCDYVAYLEGRKNGQDLYLWLSKTPSGPSVKFLVHNIHTLDELQLTGNCMKGTRPLLSFDASFDSEPQLIVMKGLLTAVFGVPEGCKKVRPYFDHVFNFSYADGKIWFRNYEIKEESVTGNDKSSSSQVSLVEMGPRFVLEPIRMLESSFAGRTIYENESYVAPNAVRAAQRVKGLNYQTRVAHKEILEDKKQNASSLPKTELDGVFD